MRRKKKINPEMAEMTEKIKTLRIIITVLQILKKLEERLNMLSRDMEDTKKETYCERYKHTAQTTETLNRKERRLEKNELWLWDHFKPPAHMYMEGKEKKYLKKQWQKNSPI